MPETIFITGGTGLIGSHLAFQALEDGHSLILLVRSQNGLLPEERFHRLADFFGYSDARSRAFLPRVRFVKGDITAKHLGLSARDFGALAKSADEIFHAAASIAFDPALHATAVRANVDGTRHVLDLAVAGDARLFHVSTAYVAGNATDVVSENALSDGHDFKNVYEQTKWQAEKMVHEVCRARGVAYAVFRPSILIGAATDGATFRFNNIFSFLKAFCLIRSRQTAGRRAPGSAAMVEWRKQALALAMRVEGDPAAEKNFVPVDYAVNAMWRISRQAACLGKTFHVTNPDPPTNERLQTVFCSIFNVGGVRYVNPDSFAAQEASPWEDALFKGTHNYRPYMFGEPRFDRTNTNLLLPGYDGEFPVLDQAFYERLLAFALDSNWGKKLLLNRAADKPGLDEDGRYVQTYFERFLPAKMNRRLIENLRSLNASCRIGLNGDPTRGWRLEIREGALVALDTGSEEVQCTFHTTPKVFRRVAEGRLSPQQAFFERQVDIGGDIEQALKVASALAQFFEEFPFVMGQGDNHT